MPVCVVFLGTPAFAVPSLQAIAGDERIDLRLVVTQPDRAAGRGRRPRAPAVKLAAEALGLPLIQPETLHDPLVLEQLRRAEADLFVVVAYGEILRRAVLELPPLGCFNVHPSLLPRYRGSAPIQAAILNGDAETGISIIRLVRRLDAGPIVRQEAVRLSGRETAGELSERLAAVASAMLPETIVDVAAGNAPAVPQNEEQATYTREITADDARIDWRAPAEQIARLVRAMAPQPKAWTLLEDTRLAVLRCDISDQPSQTRPGTLNTKAGTVSTETRDIQLVEVQPAGKQAMAAADWLRGVRIDPSVRFENPGTFDTHGRDQ